MKTYWSIHAGLKALNCNEQVRLSLKKINPTIPLTSSFRETTLKSEELLRSFAVIYWLVHSNLTENMWNIAWSEQAKYGLYC